MTVPMTFNDPQDADLAAISDLERRLGVAIPQGYRDLLTRVSNGGTVVPVGPRSAPAVGIVAVMGVARGDDLDIERRSAEYADGRLSGGLIPFADAEGGNLVCFSVRQEDYGAVWFWDHELEGTRETPTWLAADVESFLADLAPLADDVALPTINEVWVDPALRAELNDDQN